MTCPTCDILSKALSARVKVENELWQVFAGQRALPDAEQCRQWALRLGVPDEDKHRLKPPMPI